ncbi:MAG: radical SAM/SPASM family putative metalloenzyme maturase [Geobacteraceae bacterium]|nr:radical SAM/SPASM family putative metalloenzyme maturase [Geobacteraceae bacterium]
MTPPRNQAVRPILEYFACESKEPRQRPAIAAPEGTVHPAFREYPSRLFVETTTRCNLRCAMCVKQTGDSGVVDGDLSPETFRALEPALPHAEVLILNGIGEPLLNPHLEDFIRTAKGLMPAESWVGFQTNGLLLDEARALSLAEAGLDRICLSMDSVCPDTLRKIREGCEVWDLERALSALRKARERAGSSLRVGLEFVLMKENARELPDAIRWAAARGVDFAIVTHLLPYDASHTGKVAYDSNTDEAVAFFRPWKERADREGIDLRHYFKTMWNYLRTPEEQRIVDFVAEMQAEASARELFINMRNLLDRDEAWIGEMERIFAEARDAAAKAGMDLTLPEVTPRGDRRCDFVDRGGAFVSWDGGVHNCYFLWHSFSCHFSGRKKYVNARVFGSLREKGIREIWNDPAFRSFREEVLRHEYPFCSNCNLVPCEYLYNEEFTHDCFVNRVPCGDCFWCMGLFNCLQ